MGMFKEIKNDIHFSNYVIRNHGIRLLDYYSLIATSIKMLNHLVELYINDVFLPYTKSVYTVKTKNRSPIYDIKLWYNEEDLPKGRLLEPPTELLGFLNEESKTKNDEVWIYEKQAFAYEQEAAIEHLQLYREIYDCLGHLKRFKAYDIEGEITYTSRETVIPQFHYDEKLGIYKLEEDPITLASSLDLLENQNLTHYCMKLPEDKEEKREFLKYYDELRKLCGDNSNIIGLPFGLLGEKRLEYDKDKKKISSELFFVQNSKEVRPMFYDDRVLSFYDLSNINFDGVNVSKLDFSHNLEVKLNIDKIVKDLRKTNLNGYSLKKKILIDFDLTDADLRNTSAGIDLATCKISLPTKNSSGTLFDDKNSFYFGNDSVDEETLNKLKIKRL